jgi:hypothetical protein
MRDEDRNARDRLEAAKAAAPYVHPKLATMTLQGDETAPLRTINCIELIPVQPRPRD